MQQQDRNVQLRVAALSDLHINGDVRLNPREVDVRGKFEEVLGFATRFTPDLFLYMGDIAHSGETSPTEARAAYQYFRDATSHFSTPKLFVAGNHDDAETMREILQLSKVDYCSDTRMTYSSTVQGVKFIVIDANDRTLGGAQGRVCDEDLNFLRNTLENDESPCVIAIHHPPLDMDSPWLRGQMLLVNGEEFHSVLLHNRDKVRCVLFGHVHRAGTQVVDGIVYVSIGSTSFKFQNGPADQKAIIAGGDDSYFHLISFSPRGFTEKIYNVPTEYNQPRP